MSCLKESTKRNSKVRPFVELNSTLQAFVSCDSVFTGGEDKEERQTVRSRTQRTRTLILSTQRWKPVKDARRTRTSQRLWARGHRGEGETADRTEMQALKFSKGKSVEYANYPYSKWFRVSTYTQCFCLKRNPFLTIRPKCYEWIQLVALI